MTKDSKQPTNVVTMPQALKVDLLNKAIDALCKQVATIQDSIQVIGVQTLMHLKAHGDIGPVNRMFVGLGKGVRRNALGSWLMAHGSLEVNTDRDTRKTAPLKFAKAKKTDPEAAMADPWYSHLPEKNLEDVFDLQKAIHGLLVRAKGKTLVLHGKVLSVDHAVDTLKSLAAMAGEEGYKPDVHQDKEVGLPGPSVQATEVADEAPTSADTKPARNRVKGGVKAQATQAA